MKIDVLTLFPDMFTAFRNESIVGRAIRSDIAFQKPGHTGQATQIHEQRDVWKGRLKLVTAKAIAKIISNTPIPLCI